MVGFFIVVARAPETDQVEKLGSSRKIGGLIERILDIQPDAESRERLRLTQEIRNKTTDE